MMRLAICAVLSLVAHVVFEQGLELLPPAEAPPPAPRVIEVRVIPPPPKTVAIEPPPPVPPPPPPVDAPKPPDPIPVTAAKPQPQPAARPAPHLPAVSSTTPDSPAAAPSAVRTDSAPEDEVFNGGAMSSTSGGTGTGGTGGGGSGSGGGPASTAPAPPKPANGTAAIGAAEATKMPLPQGRCFGKYTPEATAAGTEGTVVLELTVDETGRPRDITVVDKLPNGLTESAIAALRACTFSPGEKDGHAVAVHIRAFKIKFVLETAQP